LIGRNSQINIGLAEKIRLIQQAESSYLKILKGLFIIATVKVGSGFFKNLEIERVSNQLMPGRSGLSSQFGAAPGQQNNKQAHQDEQNRSPLPASNQLLFSMPELTFTLFLLIRQQIKIYY